MVSRWEIDSLSRGGGGGKFWGKFQIPNCWKSLWEGMNYFSKRRSSQRDFQQREFGIFQNLMVLKKCAIIILIILSIDIIVLVQNKRSKNKFLLIDSLR